MYNQYNYAPWHCLQSLVTRTQLPFGEHQAYGAYGAYGAIQDNTIIVIIIIIMIVIVIAIAIAIMIMIILI